MVEAPENFENISITNLDLEKILEIYDKKGFGTRDDTYGLDGIHFRMYEENFVVSGTIHRGYSGALLTEF